MHEHGGSHDMIGRAKLVAHTRFQQLGQWQNFSLDSEVWVQVSDDLVKLCSTPWCCGLTLPAAQGGLPSDMQAQSKVGVGGSHAEKAAHFRARTRTKSLKVQTTCETNSNTVYKI